MPDSTRSRRDSSATHYLDNGTLAARLETTVALVARALGYPIAMINILDQYEQHTISGSGPGDFRTLPREDTFCDTVVRTGRSVTTGLARTDERFKTLPMVLDGSVSSYAGVPLAGRESHVVGALCVTDQHDRTITADDLVRLDQFGRIVEDQLDLMRSLKQQRRAGQVATTELAAAIASEQIVPWYQPIIEISTGRLRGYEALARWELPSGDVLHPKSFVPLAEDSDLVRDMDLSVMRQALSDLARWREADPRLRMSINLSGRHFEGDGGVAAIQLAVSDAGVPATSVDLEITESARLLSGAELGLAVRTLRSSGFQVWLDDFGTGWSSLEYLLWMPVTGVKLSHVVSVTMGSRIGNALIRSVTGLARELDLQTTIEGIESADNAALADELGCDNAQGYLWSEAVPASVIDELRARGRIAEPPLPASR